MNRERTGPTGNIPIFLTETTEFFSTWFNLSSQPEQLFRKKIHLRKSTLYFVIPGKS